MSSDKRVLFDYFSDTADLLFSHYKRSVTQRSPDIKGENRESFTSTFLSKVLPNRLSIENGEILDSKNNKTGQQELIIIKNDCPSLEFGLVNTYLVEGVLGVIEVKSNLTRQKLVESGNSLQQVRNLFISTIGGFSPKVMRRPLRIVFAYKGATWDTICETIEENNLDETFDLICILERGAAIRNGLLFKNENGKPSDFITFDGKAAALGFLYYILVEYGLRLLTSIINLQSYFMPFDGWSSANKEKKIV